MISLIAFNNDDADLLISWFGNEESLVQFAGPQFSYPLTKEQVERHLLDPNRFAYKVVDTATGVVVGHGEICLVPNEPPKLTCVIIGNKQYRGKGLGKEIINRLVDLCFNQLKATAVQLYVYDWNINALECYKGVGFVIDPDKTLITEVKGKKWTALNMTLSK